MIAFGEVVDPMRDFFGRADPETALRNNMEDAESEIDHNERDNDAHVSRHFRGQRDGLSKKSDESAQNRIRKKATRVEMKERLEFLPSSLGLTHFIVLCGERKQQPSCDSQAAGSAGDQADDEDSPERERTGGRRCE